MEALTSPLPELNRRRARGEGERITDDTLIRMAIEVLLSRADKLVGAT